MNILTFYIDVGNNTELGTGKYIEEIKQDIDLSVEEKIKGNILKTIFVPVRSGELGRNETRVEVIALNKGEC